MLFNLEDRFVNKVAQFSKASDPSQNESLKIIIIIKEISCPVHGKLFLFKNHSAAQQRISFFL